MTGLSLMLGISLVNQSGGGGGAPVPALLPAGSTHGWIGDGLVATAGGVGSGTNNAPHQFARLIGGRLQPVPVPNIGKSGTTIKTDIASNKAFIYPYAIDAMAAQCPDVFIIGTMGANDNLLSTDPGANPASGQTTNPYLQDWYDAVNYAYTKFSAYGGLLLVVVETAGSAKAGEATYAATVRTAMSAHVAAMTALDSKVVYVSLAAMTPASDFSIESGGQFVHLDERGGYYIANAVLSAIDAKIEAKTADEIIDLIVAGTYPLMSGAQLDADTGLAGTGGTITGPGVTAVGGSGLATTKAITNTTGATGITVEQVATSGGRTKTRVNFAGTTTGDGKVMVQDKANISVTATPGQPIRTGWMLRASAGFRNFGSEWANNFGFWGGGATSMANNALQGADETHALDNLIFNNFLGTSVQTFGNSATFSGKRSYALFFKSGDTLTGTMEIERPFTYKLSNRTRTTMAYVGDIRDSGPNYVFSGTSGGSRMRPSGTISNAAGGTLRVEPGSWNMFGLTEADFAERRFYKGGTAGQAGVGTGTLLGTAMTGSTWTQTYGAGVVTAADLVYVEITDRDGVVWRSTASVTAT
ncbi:SGNH/GDSL hydrolase family protein [Rhizobium leguminosarum bv. viciae]|nr:SGNH/GDSL hydrolase family protein [Rhizobium leguminosarum bv. viciae]